MRRCFLGRWTCLPVSKSFRLEWKCLLFVYIYIYIYIYIYLYIYIYIYIYIYMFVCVCMIRFAWGFIAYQSLLVFNAKSCLHIIIIIIIMSSYQDRFPWLSPSTRPPLEKSFILFHRSCLTDNLSRAVYTFASCVWISQFMRRCFRDSRTCSPVSKDLPLVCRCRQDSSQYSGRSQQWCSLDCFHSSSYFKVFESLYQSLSDSTNSTNYNWFVIVIYSFRVFHIG